MIIHRRKFLAGLGSMLAAPAIVHYGNLMPVKFIQELSAEEYLHRQVALGYSITMDALNDFYIGLWENSMGPSPFYGKGFHHLLTDHQASQ